MLDVEIFAKSVLIVLFIYVLYPRSEYVEMKDISWYKNSPPKKKLPWYAYLITWTIAKGFYGVTMALTMYYGNRDANYWTAFSLLLLTGIFIISWNQATVFTHDEEGQRRHDEETRAADIKAVINNQAISAVAYKIKESLYTDNKIKSILYGYSLLLLAIMLATTGLLSYQFYRDHRLTAVFYFIPVQISGFLGVYFTYRSLTLSFAQRH